jgi:hypothetical protein
MILTDLPPAAQAKVARMLASLPKDWRPVVIGEERSATGTSWTVKMIDADGATMAFFVIWCDAAELAESRPARGQP